jgi:uncharacterized protein DUF5318
MGRKWVYGVSEPGRTMPEPMATVDYRMRKRALLRQLRRGLVSRIDVCDAHPELIRAAKHIGEPTRDECPICGCEGLRLVLYTYGKELKRANGWPRRSDELRELRGSVDQFRCYVVEVCLDCGWNHLVRAFDTGRRVAG